MAMLCTLVFSFIAGFLILLVLALGRFYISPEDETFLLKHSTELQKLAQTEGLESVIAAGKALESTSSGESRPFVFIEDKNSSMLDDRLDSWPDDLPSDGVVKNFWMDQLDLMNIGEDRPCYYEPGYWPAIGFDSPEFGRVLLTRSSEFDEDLRGFAVPALCFSFLVSVAGSAVLGLSIGLILLRKVDLVNSVARDFSSGLTSRRAPTDGSGDEFDELGTHFNSMLDETERLLNNLRRTGDNVAHDLRKPLSRMFNRLEVTLLEERSAQEYQQTIEQSLGDVEALITTFNAILQINLAEGGRTKKDWTTVSLQGILEELFEFYQTGSHTLSTKFEPVSPILGNRPLLVQAVSNLLENAEKFSPPGSHIELGSYSSPGKSGLFISDSGPGIPVEQRELVLQRFFRLEEARNQPGNGLGLSLVKAIASHHDAELKLLDNSPGLKVCIEFKLPTREIVE